MANEIFFSQNYDGSMTILNGSGAGVPPVPVGDGSTLMYVAGLWTVGNGNSIGTVGGPSDNVRTKRRAKHLYFS
jgi:hypothetical protein